MAVEAAGPSKEHGVDSFGHPTDWSRNSRGSTRKEGHKEELVQMSLPCPGASQKTTTIQRMDGKTETTSRNEVNNSSLTDLEDWDLTNKSTGLVKLQNKLPQTV